MIKIFLIIAIVSFSLVLGDRWHRFELPDPLPSEMPKNLITENFPNKIDHFNLTSKMTYNQRFWYTEDYWDKEKGPMVLYLFGESAGKTLNVNSMAYEVAKKTKGKLFMLEHRFYGVSQPCKDWSVKCLRLLTHDQALADIANFIQAQNLIVKDLHRKWIIIGGSYAGALAGWMRVKYPHISYIAYSSSGVVNAITDFYQYMDQIRTDLSKDEKCYKTVLELNKFAIDIIEKGTNEEKQTLKQAMSATMLEDLDFLSYFTDMYVGAIQYSARRKVCPRIIELDSETDMMKKVKKYAEIGKDYGAEPSDYNFEEERKIEINPHSAGRQWMYQYCSAFGWFQVGKNTPLRPDYLGTEYWRKACKKVFEIDLFPNDKYINSMMGDLRPVPQMSKAIFVNGGDDPWQWAGFRDESKSNENLIVQLIKCDDCGHCLDLNAPDNSDAKELTEIREKIMNAIIKWL